MLCYGRPPPVFFDKGRLKQSFVEDDMTRISFRVQKEFCEECSLALRRFIGKVVGVQSIDGSEGQVVITYDTSKVREEDILKITKDSIEKLGYRIGE